MSAAVWLRDGVLVADCPQCGAVCPVSEEHEATCQDHGPLELPPRAVWRIRPTVAELGGQS